MIHEVKLGISEKIGSVSYEAWFLRKPVKIHSPSYGVLTIEAPSRFYKDEIIKRFGTAIHEVAVSLGYKMTHIIVTGEAIPRAEPPLTPEQWSELKAVLAKIGKFARSAGNHKASSALFTPGIEEDIVEDQKLKPTPSYVYKGNDGLGKLGFSHQNIEEQPTPTTEEPNLEDEGVIFPVLIPNQSGEEFYGRHAF